MAFTRNGEQVEVYDFVTADALVDFDQFMVDADPVEVMMTPVNDNGSVLIHAVSHLTDEPVMVILESNKEVALWRV